MRRRATLLVTSKETEFRVVILGPSKSHEYYEKRHKVRLRLEAEGMRVILPEEILERSESMAEGALIEQELELAGAANHILNIQISPGALSEYRDICTQSSIAPRCSVWIRREHRGGYSLASLEASYQQPRIMEFDEEDLQTCRLVDCCVKHVLNRRTGLTVHGR